MDRKTCLFVMLIAVVSLIVFNLGLRRGDHGDSREISGYEYTRLHLAANLYTEVADSVSEDLKHERLTMAEYNRIMQQYEKARLQQEQKRNALLASRVTVASYRRH